MWTVTTEELSPRVRRTIILEGGSRMSFDAVLAGWQRLPHFRSFFLEQLVQVPFAAYFWETPPLAADTVRRPFEFVTIDSESLGRVASDPDPFDPQFRAAAADARVITFRNLGGDATLVVPCPTGEHEVYTHLGKFVRSAPDLQKHALFEAIAVAMQECLGPRPIWLSTAGLGVSWLHVRLDSRPKYYNFSAYRDEA